MNEEPTHKQSTLETSTRLAYERTYLAHERTLMGWVRTAISLISFGFTIAKVFEYLREKHGERATLLGPRAIGIIMIATGLVALALATMQYRQALKVLHERYTNHGNSTLDKQERELYVRPSVRSECVGAPSTNRRQ